MPPKMQPPSDQTPQGGGRKAAHFSTCLESGDIAKVPQRIDAYIGLGKGVRGFGLQVGKVLGKAKKRTQQHEDKNHTNPQACWVISTRAF